MAEDSFEEKTEAPSPKRRRDAREKGNVVKSTEINSVFVLLFGILFLRLTGPWFFNQISQYTRECFTLISDVSMNQDSLIVIMKNTIVTSLLLSMPMMLVIVVVGVLANIVQIGLLFTTTPITPKLDKINPLPGLKRMFSMRSIVEAIKSIIKMLAIAIVTYLTIRAEFKNMLTLGDTSVYAIWMFLVTVGYKIFIRAALVMIIIAILDYVYQRFEHEKRLKMTHQEVKEERKQLEGDPLIKSRIRSLQREMARRRMMEEVPKATVVVTNPTTYAIALRYVAAEMVAPVVLAKGKLLIAERIKQIARENDIPVVEDKLLVRAMYDKVDLGQQIPLQFYNAVAEILAYVYKLNNKAAA